MGDDWVMMLCKVPAELAQAVYLDGPTEAVNELRLNMMRPAREVVLNDQSCRKLASSRLPAAVSTLSG